MSYYTSTGLTVSPEHGEALMCILARAEDRPDVVARGRGGSVTAVWKDRNHFEADGTFREVLRFLDGIGEDGYALEIIDEDWDRETRGDYSFEFGTSIEYEVYGDPVDLDVVSMNIIAKGGRGRTAGKRHPEGAGAAKTAKPVKKKAQSGGAPWKAAARGKKVAAAKTTTAGTVGGARTSTRAGRYPIRFADPAARRRRWGSAGRSGGGTKAFAAGSAATWLTTPT